jgi:bifunctional oligoribonuclease and PAP phosphatase NrnA
MELEVQKLKKLIESSARILITSHISPDPDAVSSLLLFGETLRLNYPAKSIQMVLEEKPLKMEFLNGYGEIKIAKLTDVTEEFKPELMVILDANNVTRVSREDSDRLIELIANQAIKTAIIDHHEPAGKDNSDVYINQGSPAAAQDVYEILLDRLAYKKPEDYAQTTMTGLYADTGGFAYDNPRHTDTLKLTDELLRAGANIEAVRTNLFRYSQNDLAVLGELAANAAHQNDYTYSFISDEFVNDWVNRGKTGAELHMGTEDFVNQYLRNIDGRKWGFIVYKNVLSNEDEYSASFRSVGGAKDVSEIAGRLGGGGHKPAAGAKFQAGSVEQALKIVHKAILEP